MHVTCASKEKPDLHPNRFAATFRYGRLNIIFIDVFLHIFRFDAILSANLVYGGIPQWPKSILGLR